MYTRTAQSKLGTLEGDGTLGFDPRELVSTIAGGANAQIVFRSQLTPEIRMNVADMLAGRASSVQTDSGPGVMNLFRPEITITAAGVEKHIAPYGRPVANYFALLAGGAVATTLIGAAIAWRLCRG